MESKKQGKNQRFLSPSFKKGAIKESKKTEDFHINLMGGDSDSDEQSSPKPHNQKQKRLNVNDNNNSQKKSSHHDSPNKKEKKIDTTNMTIKNLAYQSQAGKGEDGFTKINQDSYLVIPNEYKLNDFNIFSVMDGHGLNGHLVSQFCTKYFTSYFAKNKKLNQLTDEESVYNTLKKNNYEIIKKAFHKAEKEISKSDIDANFSGTTCVMTFQIGNKLITANVGDSRGIIIKGDKAIPLSIDQKPNNENEMKRIIKNGGEVSQYEEDGIKSGPYRVWKKGEMYPGIAMSRSIGDLLASSLGVIPEPEFIEMEIDKDTKFVILASDGVWEFLDNKKVKDLVMPFYKKNDPEGACKMLINESTKWWNEEDIVVDDITVICLFF